MNYYEFNTAIIDAQYQYKEAAKHLTKLICDINAVSSAVELAKAVVNKMEYNLAKLTSDFNAKY